MKLHAFIGCVALVGCASDEQPPVYFLVEMHKAGRIVECTNAQTVLGKNVRVRLSNGMAVSALARPMADDGRTNVTVRFETPPLPGPGALQAAHEMSASFNLAQSSPSMQDTWAGPNGISFVVLVTSPALLATTRGEPSWKQHLDKPLNVSNRTPSGECTPVLAKRTNDG